MSAHALSTTDLDAQLAALMDKAEEKSSSGDIKILRLTSDFPLGTYRVNILPNGDMSSPQWWATYGTHYMKPINPLTGQEDKSRKGKMYVCNDHTHDRGCKVCESIGMVKNLYKDLEARDENDPERMAKFPMVSMQYAAADSAFASPRITVNAIIRPLSDPSAAGEVVLLQIPKSFRDEMFKMARMISLRFFAPEANICWHVKVEKLPNRHGNTPSLVGRENPVDLVAAGVDLSKLNNLSSVVFSKIGNMNRAESFNGDFFAMAAANPALAAPSGGVGLPSLSAPATFGLPGSLAAPSFAPAVAPAIVAPAPAPAVFVAPITAPAPAPAESNSEAAQYAEFQAFKAAQLASAQAAAVPPAPSAVVAPAPAPSAIPSLAEQDELEKKLMAMIG